MKRESGVEGSVYQATFKTKDGTIKTCETWTARWYGDGRHNKKAGFKTEKKAWEYIRSKRAEVMAHTFIAGTDNLKFEAIRGLLLGHYTTNKKKSIERVKAAAGHLDTFFKGMPIKAITPAKVLQYIVTRQAEKIPPANATINRELAALKSMFRLAAKMNMVARVPYIKLLDEADPRSGFFEREVFDAIKAHLPERLKNLVEVAYITGWRVSDEIVTRKWQHVDLKAGWLRLEPGETKSKDGRMFPLLPHLRAALEAQREATDALQHQVGRVIPNVFWLEDGQSFKSFYQAWKTACKKAGFPEAQRHDFRRTAVRNLERFGISRSAAMKMVGHKTESIYRRYAIVAERDLVEAGEKLAAGLDSMGLDVSTSESGPVGPQSNGLRAMRRVQPLEKIGGLGRD